MPRHRRSPGPPGWLIARDALLRAALLRAARARAGAGARLETDRVRKLGEGLNRDVFQTYLEVSPDPAGLSGDYAMLVPRPDADDEVDERARREAALLERFAGLLPDPPPFRVPRALSAVDVAGRTVLVRELVEGIPVKLRADHTQARAPWELGRRMAAAVHDIDAAAVADIVPRDPTRREHAATLVAEAFAGLGHEVGEARDWATTHLPPAEPSALLHGDLLGQNILVRLEGPPALIDWEFARRGDPAYDLAIVTRGVRRPFGVEGGLERLLAAYRAAGGHPVTPRDVRLHELCLAALWFRDSLAGESRDPPDEALARVERVLHWARRAAD